MRKSATYRKDVTRLRNELRNRNSASSSNGVENYEHETRPPGLKGREIGLWYAQRNKRKKEQEGGESERRSRMVKLILFLRFYVKLIFLI